MGIRGTAAGTAALVQAFLLVSCGAGGTSPEAASPETSSAGPITLYTCASDSYLQPVIAAFEEAHPGGEVELYRAPTGDLNARIAGEVRSGGLQADVVWACDPLTMQDYVDQGLVGGWTPETDAPAELRTDDYVGVHVLYMVVVTGKGVPQPDAWSDLTGAQYADAVAVPDPAFAASALGTLGYFSQDPKLGLEFYEALRGNGAVQVSTPDDVTTGVAEGIYRAGMTTATSAGAARDDGSPIEVVWPEPGAVAIYGPAGLATGSADSETAKDFISFVTSAEGQSVLAEAGAHPTLPGAGGPPVPQDAPVVFPDWSALAAQKDDLLTEYQQIFGG